MAVKQYFFSVDELEALIRTTIAFRAPAVASVIDASSILGAIIDIVMYGQPIKQRYSPLEILTELFVPTDIAKETIDYLCDIVNRSLASGIGEINNNLSYDWDILPGRGDLVITVKPKLRTYPRQTEDPDESLQLSIKTAMDNWDYIPEKIRRIVEG